MQTLRQLCTTVVLTLVIACSAYAGEISCPIAAPPATGQIETPLTEVALSLVQSMLALF